MVLAGKSLDEERALAAAAVLAILVSATMFDLYSPSLLSPEPTYDIHYYFLGEDPEGGTLAYPAGALFYFSLIRAVAWTPELFTTAFRLLSALWIGAVLWVFWKNGAGWPGMLLASSIFAVLAMLVFDRVETLAIALALLGVWLFSEGKRMAGWLLVAAGAFVKVFPVFLLPLFAILEVRAGKGGWMRIGAAALACLLALAASPDTIGSLAYQAGRGVQIESIYANALFVAEPFNPIGLGTEECFGSVHLVLPEGLRWVAPASTALQALAVIAVAAAFFLDRRNRERIWEYCFLVVAVAVLFGKIGSTQFVMWPIAFAIPLAAKGNRALWAGCAGLAVFATLVFPFGWYSLAAMNPLAVLFLSARNTILACMVAIVWAGLNEKRAEKAQDVP